jgi:hypothetical protein
MIRIDEIYDHTFWPYFRRHLPFTKMFYCDPPGRSDAESLCNTSEDAEVNYIFFHDQEPIHTDIHAPLFDEVNRRGGTLNNYAGPKHAAIITSERDSEIVDQVCSQNHWRPYYYFFHGWASLDWYRGYDRTYLMPEPHERRITKSYISPNRIIGGRRQHRVVLMYHLLKQGIKNAWVSFPKSCPVENIDISDIAKNFRKQYPDILDVFAAADLPRNFPGETGHPMHSCWLSLFDECAETLAFVSTETVFEGRRHHLTEKSFKPICLRMPFVLVSTAGSLEYLRSYGFKTFDSIWDESYDTETDDARRLAKIADLLHSLDQLTDAEKQARFEAARPIIEHNFNHFYSGAFEQILWQELVNMLDTMQQDFGQ